MSAVPQPGLSSGTVRLSVDPEDAHRAMTQVATGLALVGLTMAVGMAVFGLPPVDLHGPLHRFGIMDPLCGGTRAARLTAQGHLAQAWTYNPLGILAVLGAAGVVLRTVTGAVTCRRVNLHSRLTRRRRRQLLVLLLIAILALEIRQQLRADLLIAGT
jgi:hypothetical protein